MHHRPIILRVYFEATWQTHQWTKQSPAKTLFQYRQKRNNLKWSGEHNNFILSQILRIGHAIKCPNTSRRELSGRGISPSDQVFPKRKGTVDSCTQHREEKQEEYNRI